MTDSWPTRRPETHAPLEFRGLTEANARRLALWHRPGTEPWSLADWSNAMNGEAGECANFIKKLRRLETGLATPTQGVSDLDVQILVTKAGREIADTVIYGDLLAQQLHQKYGGMLLDDLVVTKFNDVSDREGFKVYL